MWRAAPFSAVGLDAALLVLAVLSRRGPFSLCSSSASFWLMSSAVVGGIDDLLRQFFERAAPLWLLCRRCWWRCTSVVVVVVVAVCGVVSAPACGEDGPLGVVPTAAASAAGYDGGGGRLRASCVSCASLRLVPIVSREELSASGAPRPATASFVALPPMCVADRAQSLRHHKAGRASESDRRQPARLHFFPCFLVAAHTLCHHQQRLQRTQTSTHNRARD